MKFKKKILIPFALFAMFSMEYKQVFASVGYDGVVPLISSNKMFDNDLNTYVDLNGVPSNSSPLTLYSGSPVTIEYYNSFSTTQLLLNPGHSINIKYTLNDGTTIINPSVTLMTTETVNASYNEYLYKNNTPVQNVVKMEIYRTTTYGAGAAKVYEMDWFQSIPDSIPPSPITNLSYVFGDENSVTYTYNFPTDPDFSHIQVYQDAQLLKDNYKGSSLKITDLQPEMNYNFHFYSVDTSGNKSNVYSSTIQMPAGPDLIAPQNITSVENVVSDTSIQFSYLLPIDSDFSHLQVYRNNQLIAPNVQLASFVDEGLDYETSYTYSFKSVDTSGNISEGTTLTLQTMPYNDLTPPSAPTGLDVLTGNSSLALSWFSNPENDVQGYNVYVDGVKRNGAPVFGNSYSLTNLANANEYLIQISAVDTNGNESPLTAQISGIPDGSKIPFFKLDNDLTDVVESTENWFSEMWLIVAFSAGIPLAFVVGNRIKSLFFA